MVAKKVAMVRQRPLLIALVGLVLLCQGCGRVESSSPVSTVLDHYRCLLLAQVRPLYRRSVLIPRCRCWSPMPTSYRTSTRTPALCTKERTLLCCRRPFPVVKSPGCLRPGPGKGCTGGRGLADDHRRSIPAFLFYYHHPATGERYLHDYHRCRSP